MIIFYSGQKSKDVSPEDFLAKHGPGLMLTYSDFHGKKSSESIRRFKRHRKKIRKRDGK